MKNKKFIALCLCLATAVSFTACGEKPTGGDAGEEEVSVYDEVWDGTYKGEEVFTTDQTVGTESYNFTATNSNGLVMDGLTVTFEKLDIKKTSDRSRIKDAALSKGLGASCLTMNGYLTVSEGNITTDAAGASGVFTYTGANSDLTAMTISTAGVYSPGVACAGGGSATLNQSNVTTEGRESAGVRCVDENSYMNVIESSIETKGKNSPGVYTSTAIDLKDCQVTAYSSEVMRFDGLATTWTEGCTLTGNKTGNNANDFNWSVIACSEEKPQGDDRAEVFLNTCSLTSHSDGMFYATNTNCAFYLDTCELVNDGGDKEFLIRCQGNNDIWGRAGSNGAKCYFSLGATKAEGDIYYDSTSELQFYISNESSLTGTVKKDERFAGEGGNGFCTIGVEDGCKWIVTDSCEFENLECCGEIVDEEGKAVTVKGRDGAVYMEGDSEITVTVDTFSEVLNY